MWIKESWLGSTILEQLESYQERRYGQESNEIKNSIIGGKFLSPPRKHLRRSLIKFDRGTRERGGDELKQALSVVSADGVENARRKGRTRRGADQSSQDAQQKQKKRKRKRKTSGKALEGALRLDR